MGDKLPANIPHRKPNEPLCVLAAACTTCPYRRDTPSGIWSQHEYEKLRTYDEGHVLKLPDGSPVQVPELATFWCHQTAAAEKPIACRGWLSVHRDHAAVNVAMARGAIRPEDIPTDDESTVYYANGTEACEAGLRDLRKPSHAARAAVMKLEARGVGKKKRKPRRKKR